MHTIIVSRGDETKRVVEDNHVSTISFLGAQTCGARTKLGIGVLFPPRGNGFFWGVLRRSSHERHNLIASWRAWRILEEARYIGSTTFGACLASGHHTIPSHDQEYVNMLWSQLGACSSTTRKEICASLPTINELLTMTSALKEAGVLCSAREILREYSRTGVCLPKHIVEAAHSEPAETMWERCTQYAHNLFH